MGWFKAIIPYTIVRGFNNLHILGLKTYRRVGKDLNIIYDYRSKVYTSKHKLNWRNLTTTKHLWL